MSCAKHGYTYECAKCLRKELEKAQAALRDLWKFRGHVDEPVTQQWFLDDNPEHRAAIEKAMGDRKSTE